MTADDRPVRYTLRVLERNTGREVTCVAGVREDRLEPEKLRLRSGWPPRNFKVVAERQRPAPVAAPDARAPGRAPIPERTRHEVWRRDHGRCVDCGSRSRLEFDHIIPISKGGSNTTRNLELRCETCNRKKAARI